MVDIAKLGLAVDSTDVRRAGKDLDTLSDKGDKAEGKLSASFKRMAGGASIAAGAIAGLLKVGSVQREMDKFNAGLITATGSAKNAGIAFSALEDFAANTPYLLNQSVEAFTKLVNLGLTPSQRALESYGDTASAMGKDLTQLIEAVADAATGEFERLKEFGIKAKSEGDKVSFTFRGVTTTVRKNAQEIESYLIALGENNFAGAMAARMATLDGALSNFGDEWDKLFRNISAQGVGELMEDSVRLGISALSELNASLASGQVAAHLDAIVSKFDGFGRDVSAAMNAIGVIWSDFWDDDNVAVVENFVGFVTDSLKNLPENVRAVIQLVAVEVGALADIGAAQAEAFGNVLGIEFAKIIDKAKSYGIAIADALNPFSSGDFDLEAELKRADEVAADLTDNAIDRANEAANIAIQARRDSIEAILLERQAALDSTAAQVQAAEDLRAKYDELIAARRSASGDPLAGFSTAGDAESAATGAAKTSVLGDFEKLESSLSDPESDREKELAKNEEAIKIIQQAGELKLAEEARVNQALEDERARHKKAMDAIEQAEANNRLEIAGSIFGNLSSLMNSGNKKLFELGKKAAIATAIVDAATGINKALASAPPPFNFALAASVAAATAVQIKTIRSQQFGGSSSTPSVSGSASAGGGSALNTASNQAVATNQTPAEPARSGPQIYINNVNGRDAEALLDDLKEVITKKDFVFIEEGSRQAEIIRGDQSRTRQ